MPREACGSGSWGRWGDRGHPRVCAWRWVLCGADLEAQRDVVLGGGLAGGKPCWESAPTPAAFTGKAQNMDLALQVSGCQGWGGRGAQGWGWKGCPELGWAGCPEAPVLEGADSATFVRLRCAAGAASGVWLAWPQAAVRHGLADLVCSMSPAGARVRVQQLWG